MYKTVSSEITNDVWEKYQQSHSISLRNKILTEYLYIVTLNAKRMSAVYKNKADLEDVVNQGVLALIDCIDRYDCQKGVQFDSFASIRVRGSIIDYIRKQDWVPRDIRKKSIDISNAYMELQASLERQPTDEEVATHAGLSGDEYNKVLAESNSFAVLSYEELLQDAVPSFQEPVSTIKVPGQQLEEEEIKEIIATGIDRLSEKERLIISLYYYEELKLKEIAAIMGITASRVSQLHTKALMKLRSTVGAYVHS